MTKTKKTNGRAKAHAKTAEVKFDTTGARKQAAHALARVQDGLREAGGKRSAKRAKRWAARAARSH